MVSKIFLQYIKRLTIINYLCLSLKLLIATVLSDYAVAIISDY
jgi:hypothetical protein